MGDFCYLASDNRKEGFVILSRSTQIYKCLRQSLISGRMDRNNSSSRCLNDPRITKDGF